MTCHNCQATCKRFGRHRNGLQRFRCRKCGKTLTEAHEKPLDEMRLPPDRAVEVLRLLLEGMSVRSVERVTEVHRDTILKLLILAGARCQRLMEEKIKDIRVYNVEVDEIWGFVFKKEGHKWDHEKQVEVYGDAWCYAALERDSKLVLAWHLGKRDALSTQNFIGKLARATSQDRFQLTSDGFKHYPKYVKDRLYGRVDYAKLVKVYSTPREGQQRYSPGEVVDAVPVPVMGRPNRKMICTSHIERTNLSIRMGMRRMTRLTNGFSKKWENLEAAYAVWFAYYNFCRKHQSLKITPAMEQGLTDHQWTVGELVGV
jgi:transposase-like protein/IS1 family transposase